MNKRSGHKRSGRKHSRRTAKKERKDKRKAYRKGSKSKTMKGKKDFTTKKTSKVFNRRRHYQKHAKGSRVIRRPYAKKGGSQQLRPAGFRPQIPSSDSTNFGMNKQMANSGGVTMGPDGRLRIDGHRPHTGPPSKPPASASTKTSSRVKSSNPLIVKTKSGAYVFDGRAGAVSGN